MFRDGDELELGSRNDRPLTRYFPELVELLRSALPDRCVVDGEIVVVTETGLDFDALQQRLHPAASRVKRLAEETPSSFVAFDLLALGDEDLTEQPFRERRRRLEAIVGGDLGRVHLTPTTDDPDVAQDWFTRFEGAGFDGVMAKPGDQPYQQDKRVMWKVKHERTADCVVAGFRMHKDGEGVGSLLLGLFDDEGSLHHVGVASSFTAARRRELVGELAPLRERRARGPSVAGVGRAQAQAEATGKMPGGVEPVERAEGPVVGAAAPGAGRRGSLRARARRALPPRRSSRPLPSRPHAGVLHLRAARRGGPRRARRHLQLTGVKAPSV